MVPEGHPIPAEISLGEFPADAQHLVAGSVTIINNKQLRISNFHYDGTAPGQSRSSSKFNSLRSYMYM